MNDTQLGRVSSVFVDQDLNKVFVSVVTGPGVEPREIPFVTSKPSFWLVPEEGDIVEVTTVDRDGLRGSLIMRERPPFPTD